MTTVKYYRDRLRMEIKGHAGSAPRGEDLVCAACTAYARQLLVAATYVPEYQAKLYINDIDALIEVECNPSEEFEKACRYMMDVVYIGYETLASQFPQYVKLGG